MFDTSELDESKETLLVFLSTDGQQFEQRHSALWKASNTGYHPEMFL